MKNPAAFPMAHPSKEIRFQDIGMSLRDYFAAKGMAAIVNEPSAVREIDKQWPDELAKRIAIAAYRIADAMLAERERTDAS